MTDKFQHIIHVLKTSKQARILLHLVFWLVVAYFYFVVFNWNSAYKEASIIFSVGLLPIAILTTYFFNYFIIPRFLWKKRYIKFLAYGSITFVVNIWLAFLIVFYALIYVLKEKSSIDPSTLHPELHVMTLNFIVFFGIATKQVKRAFIILQERNQLQTQQLNTELKLKDAELKLLKAQIHPHFLFNTLNNLYGLTLEKSEEAPQLVLHLAEVLDYILYRCNEKYVLLNDEIKNLKTYIEIEKVRYSNKLIMNDNFQNKKADLTIAPLLLLPFIENAFKHGVSHSPHKTTVNIQLKTEGNHLFFSISNPKHNQKITQRNFSKGIGLNNVQKRLEMLYPKKFILEINDEKDSFNVHLQIELKP